MTLASLVTQAREQLRTEAVLDRELLLAMGAARGSSLCFLDELELGVLATLGPTGVTDCAPGSRLCTTDDSAPHPLVVIRSRETQLEKLAALQAPAVVLTRLESELDELRREPHAAFDWGSIHRYPDDARLFPAFEHDLRWMRAAASLVVANAAPEDRDRAMPLKAELDSANAFLVKRGRSGNGRSSVTHFIECALDHLSQTYQRTDQDLMAEIAVAAIVATTHADERSAWRSFLEEIWWATWA